MLFMTIALCLKTYVTFLGFDVLCQPKRIRNSIFPYLFMLLVSIGLAQSLFYLQAHPALSLIISIGDILLITLFYQCSLTQRLLFSLAIIIITSVSEFLSALVLNVLNISMTYFFTNVENTYTVIQVMLTSVIFFMLISFIRVTKERKGLLSKNILLVFYPICSLCILTLLMWAIFRNGSETVSYVLCFVIIILVFISNLLLINIINHTIDSELDKQRKQFLEKTIETQRLHQADMLQSQNEIRRVRHDLSASLSHLSGLIKAGKLAECNDLISALTHTVTENNYLALTGYPGLDAVLSTKIRNAKNKAILVNTLITLPEQENNQIDELDLSFICANILDNAIEATEHCAIIDPAITFKISFDAKLKTLYITCQNPTINESLTKTTKADQRNHGFGLSTIRQIAKRYGGTVNCQIEDGWFLIVVGMPE